MYIFYGFNDKVLNITDMLIKKCCKNDIIYIPISDVKRTNIFNIDPCIGVHKYIYVNFVNDNNYDENTNKYDEKVPIYIDILNKITYTENAHNNPKIYETYIDSEKILNNIQSKLNINHGSFREEYQEQYMVAKYITGHEKILEIGGNIGRNTMIISYILNSKDNYHVVLETDSRYFNILNENINSNMLKCHSLNCALSKRELVQADNITYPITDVFMNTDIYTKVNTITYEALCATTKINFDTLVLDCEGAFFNILKDFPNILNNINLIIMENDYYNIDEYNYVKECLEKNIFHKIFSLSGGWGVCYNNFYEVWCK